MTEARSAPLQAPPLTTASIAWIGRIDALLPQTQCRQCGFDACRPYAQAIAEGRADINRCPPGGQANIARLAALTGRPVRALDPDCGVEGPREQAWIDPSACIGCTLCIQACPVDAIIGAPKALHGVLSEDCTGCRLCLPPCPVDCIHMEAVPGDTGWTTAQAEGARRRFEAHEARLGRATLPAVPATLPAVTSPAVDLPAVTLPIATPPSTAEPSATVTSIPAPSAVPPSDTAPSAVAPPVEAPTIAAEDPAAARRRRLVEAAMAKARARSL